MAKRTPRIKRTQTKAPRRDLTYSGGVREVIGFTADLNGLTELETVQNNLFGLFEYSGPNHTLVVGDIAETSSAIVIEPPFPYKDLVRLNLASTILNQCVQAMVENVEGFGSDFVYIGPEGQQGSRAALNEKAALGRIINTIVGNGDTLQKMREDMRVDKETIGHRAFEVVEDAAGRVVEINHVEAVTLRTTKRDKEYTPYVKRTHDGRMVVAKRRFRRFLQVDDRGNKRWFKEFGDPRIINYKTGKEDNSLAIEDEATSLYYDGFYTPGTPYGTPRWSGAIPAMLGAREAEMVNLNFFRDNAIPALAVLVSGGALTEDSFQKIDEYITGVRGQSSMNRIVVLEATPEGAEAAAIDGSLPAPRVDIKPMLSERQHEGLFENYVHDSERKVREAFRLPPIYIGSAEEYNRASAFASMLTAEQQIFIPERQRWDRIFHDVVLSSYRPRFWAYRSNASDISDTAEVARLVNSLGREGALTPNAAIKIANRYLNTEIPPVSEEWGDVPFSIVSDYISAGRTLEGLDIFTDSITDAATQETPAENNGNQQGVTARMVQRMLDELSDNLSETVQSIAA